MRITKEMKAGIINDALLFKFKALEAEIEAERTALADAMYDHLFGAVEAQARAMPEGWIAYVQGLTISCDGFAWQRLNSKGELLNPEMLGRDLKLSKPRPFPDNMSAFNLKITSDHPLWKQAWGLVKKHRKVLEDKTELRRKISALLAACTTLKQLREAWPEGEPFFPAEIKHSTALVPVGLSDQINKALGIPSAASVATQAVRKAANT